jgi:thiol:disulfide interchange protein
MGIVRGIRGGSGGLWLAVVMTVATVAAGLQLALLAAPASAQQGPPHVAASLIAETRNAMAGRPLRIALREQIAPGWHTYWVNPGESGLPTTITWSLPPGFAAGPIQWPTPKRFTVGPVVDYGYEGDVLLPVTVDVAAGLNPGSEMTLQAHASWLVCSDTCIPEEADVSLTLPVGAALEPSPDWAGAFAALRTRMPSPNPFATTVAVSGDAYELRIATGDATHLKDVAFFPARAGVIDDGAPQSVKATSEGLVVTLRRAEEKPLAAQLSGVLTFRDEAAQAGGEFGAISIAAPVGTAVAPDIGFAAALLLALVGGLILNLMPCVLPVLFIKVLSLIEHSGASRHEIRLRGLVYAVGVLASFAVLGGVLLGMRAAGSEIGWGFQLQSPIFVALMIYLLFTVGLNLSGVFEIGSSLTGLGSGLAMRDGRAGSFFAGALATLVATPCTAPFMAGALGYAITQPWYVSLAILEAVGAGLALPYVAIAFMPQSRRLLPRPGMWMLRFKQVLAFPVYGTIVWLTFVLSEQSGALAVTAALSGLVLIAFAAWLFECVRGSEGWARFVGNALAVTAAVAALVLAWITGNDAAAPSQAASAAGGGIAWQAFTQERLDMARAEGKPAFVDVTAAWCITCKVNERIALSDPAVIGALADEQVITLRADWTRQDPAVTRFLQAQGRAGVPLYVFYPRPGADGARKDPMILPQVLTAGAVLRDIRQE